MFCLNICVLLVDLEPVRCWESKPGSCARDEAGPSPAEQPCPAQLQDVTMVFVLQVIVWGNYGRMERKQFMGVARVLLEELDLTTLAVGWYKLFPTSSMVDPATGPLLRQASQLSLESTVGPCGERS